MATQEELILATKKAALAGDSTSAKELAEAVRSTRMQEEVIVKGSRDRALAEQALDGEFLIDFVNKLPSEGRPGTPLGFMMGLGINNQDTDFRSLKKPFRVGGKSVYGAYVPKGSRFATDREQISGMLTENNNNMVTPYTQGEEDILYYTPQYVAEQRGVADRIGVVDTIAHELFHKGSILALPVIEDMLQEKGGPFKLMSLNKDKLREFKQSFEDDKTHSKYLDAMDKYYLVGGDMSLLSKQEQQAINDIRAISTAVEGYLTADKKEKYKIRTPIKSTKPKKKGMFTEASENKKDDPSMYRSDGSKKSARGFLGPVKNKVEGGTMTEVSVGMEINGKEMEVPTMVPTLTKQEIETLSNMKLEGNARNIPESIIMKAKQHALQRIEQGLSPFYQDGEEKGR